MVESLKQLNDICQKPRYREVGNWMVRHILRDAALPVTWLLLHTNITANQVTLASLVIGLLGIALISVPSQASFFTGVLLFQFWYLLDHVDGQIARYRKTASLTGRFFDYLMHHLIHTVCPFSLGLYAYFVSDFFVYVIFGFIASVSITAFNMIHDIKYKTFFERLDTERSVQMNEAKTAGSEGRQNTFKKIFSRIHKSAEIHVLMNILTAAVLLQWLIPMVDFRFLVFYYYCFSMPFLAVVKINYIIRNKKIDQEFESNFTRVAS